MDIVVLCNYYVDRFPVLINDWLRNILVLGFTGMFWGLLIGYEKVIILCIHSISLRAPTSLFNRQDILLNKLIVLFVARYPVRNDSHSTLEEKREKKSDATSRRS